MIFTISKGSSTGEVALDSRAGSSWPPKNARLHNWSWPTFDHCTDSNNHQSGSENSAAGSGQKPIPQPAMTRWAYDHVEVGVISLETILMTNPDVAAQHPTTETFQALFGVAFGFVVSTPGF